MNRNIRINSMSWRQHHGHATTPAPLDADERDLKFKPGMTGAEQKVRAKELRKVAEQRGMLREVEREKKKEMMKEAANIVPEPEVTATPPPPQRICTFFLQGKCARGARCKFRHESPTAEPSEGEEAQMASRIEVVDHLSADLWLLVISRLSVAGVCSVARSCKALATVVSAPRLWDDLHARTFGEGGSVCGDGEVVGDGVGKGGRADEGDGGGDGSSRGGGSGPAESSSAAGRVASSARLECCRSESTLRGWARAAFEVPAELPLAQPSFVAICGGVGVSTHGGSEGKCVRLWEVRSGRRLGLKTLKVRGGHAPPASLSHTLLPILLQLLFPLFTHSDGARTALAPLWLG